MRLIDADKLIEKIRIECYTEWTGDDIEDGIVRGYQDVLEWIDEQPRLERLGCYGIAVKNTNALITNEGLPVLFLGYAEAERHIQSIPMQKLCFLTKREADDFRVCRVHIDWW